MCEIDDEGLPFELDVIKSVAGNIKLKSKHSCDVNNRLEMDTNEYAEYV